MASALSPTGTRPRIVVRGGAGVAPSSRRLLLFAGPVSGGLLAQSLMVLVSTAMVGRLGEAALAGVGVAGSLFGVLLALLYGPVAAVQALTARSLGAGRPADAGRVLNEGLVLAGGLSLVLAALAMFGCAALLPLVLHDAAADEAGARYLLGFGPIVVCLAANMTFAAYWNGSAAPRRALYVGALQLPLHVLFNYALVFGHFGAPALGVFGAGLGSTLSAGCASLMHLALATRLASIAGFLRARPTMAGVRTLLAIGLPISLQQSMLGVGLAIYFAIVARMGVGAAAGLNAIGSLLAIPGLLSSGVGAAASTHVGAALGRGDAPVAARTGWRSARLGALVVAPLALVLVLAPGQTLALFLKDPAAVAQAMLPLRILALSAAADAFTGALISSLTGAGATRLASATSFTLQWALQLPLCWYVGTWLGFGLTGVGVVFLARSLIEAAILAALWRAGWWRRALAPTTGHEMLAVVLAARRIVIMGGAGAGKSTLARALAERLGLPTVHLDRLRYGPNWTLVEPALFRQRLRETACAERWIVDGTYGESDEALLPRADLVLWLEQPTPLRLLRAWGKTRRHRGRPRADRPDGCEEVFGWKYVRTIVGFGRWTPGYEARFAASAPAARVLRLRGDRERARLLDGLARERPIGSASV
jgi:putative MATE family efflux protein